MPQAYDKYMKPISSGRECRITRIMSTRCLEMIKIQNKKFNNQLKKFIVAVLKVLKEERKRTKIRKSQKEDIVWKENGYIIPIRQEYNF